MKRLLPLLFALLTLVPCLAQEKRITPVEVDDEKPQQPVLHYYDKHGELLEEPVLFLAELDTISSPKPAPIYPLINGISVGANFFDAIMLGCGQKHASLDLWADISLYNWFFPVVEMGIGWANNTPEFGNFTYKSKPSFYAKLGINYNLLYKSNPAYQGFAGIRFAFSSYSYDIQDVTINSGYWGETMHPSIMGQKASAAWGEFLVGIKVKLFDNLSMGWTGRFKLMFHKGKGSNSEPWFIPGYGTRSIGATFSLIYTIPFVRGKMNLPPGATDPSATR